eukprot:TRINITY_DN25827_c0_g1_i1.p1 TRINITY_DN25827_c0_g1~~TRINITY_DN25827_c0_g1_i1.p1  ORF type:complete len:160 (+),score=36.19 TRINITY_DN25827_c0_g1_i1:172-651(+)
MELLGMMAPKLMGNGRGVSSKIYMMILTKLFGAGQEEKRFKTYPLDAIHYTQGVQYNRAQDVSWMFPLDELMDKDSNKPVLVNGHSVPDMAKSTEVIIAAIDLYHEKIRKEGHYPHSSGVEVRIFKGSEVALSIGYGMKYCCAIEIGGRSSETAKAHRG